MKKNILSAILLLFAVTVMAENQEIDNGYRWYLQAHINAGYNANEDMRYYGFGKGIGFGGDLSLGYNFDDFWGMYLEVGANRNKGAYLDGPVGCNKWTGFSFTTIEPTLNVTYNLTNGFLGYKPYRRNALYIHAGLGAAFALNNNAPAKLSDGQPSPVVTDNQTSFKGSIGFNYVYMFNNTLAFTGDATFNVLGDNVNGCDWQVPFDGCVNIGVGLRVYLSKSKKAAREFIYVDEIKVINDTITNYKKVEVDEQDVYPIFFDINADKLQTSQKDIVKTVAEQLAAKPSKVVYVLGYADANTENVDNTQLAKTRAENITAELIALGIDADRIITHDMGGNVQPFVNLTSKNRSTICIITDLKH